MSRESNERQVRLEKIIAEYLEAVDVGESPESESYLNQYPELADDLREFFRNQAEVENLVAEPASDDEPSPASDVNETTVIGNDAPALEATFVPKTEPTQQGRPPRERIGYFGDYELISEIARGGMGVVYKAKQVNLDRIVALKMILSGQFASEEDVRRFYQEAEAAANLEHPGIVPIFEVGRHEGHHFFSMAFVEGPSLAHLVANSPLPAKTAAEVMKHVADAITYAHDRGVIHRDLKPANILMARKTERGDSSGSQAVTLSTAEGTDATGVFQPKVTDFGLAKKSEGGSELTGTGQILGTPSYMPPEQASGHAQDIAPSADIYSLGAVLYCLLTGHPPFQAANVLDTLMQVLEKEPVSPRDINPRIPKDLETICLKCLQKDRRKRFGSALALAEDLGRFLEGRPVLARPVGMATKCYRWARRNRSIAYLLGIIVLLVCCGFAGSTWFAVYAGLMAQSERHAKNEAIFNEDRAEQERQRADEQSKIAQRKRQEAEREKRHAEQQLTISRRALYALQLSRSHENWRTKPFVAFGGLLNEDRCPPDLRDFCWRYAANLTNRFVKEYPGHQAPKSIDVSNDGKLFASCFFSSNIKVISKETGQVWPMKEKPQAWVRKVRFLPDNRTLLSAGHDKRVTVWNALTGQKIRAIDHGERVGALAVSPDGKWVACGGDEQTRVWQTGEWNEKKTFPFGSRELTFTKDGKNLIVAQDKSILFKNLETDETETWEGHETAINGLDVSPDGNLLLSSDTQTVLLREIGTGKVIHRVTEPLKPEFREVRFSPDGTSFATTSGNYPIKLWSVQTGQLVGAVTPYYGSTSTLAFLPEGRLILTPAEHGKANLKLWKLPSLNPEVAVKHSSLWISSARDRNRLATTDQNQIQIWDHQSPQVIHSWTPRESDKIEGPIGGLEFLPGGKQLLSIHEKHAVALWEVDSGKLIRKFEGLDRGKAIAFDPVHRRIALPGPGKVVCLRDLETGKEIKKLGRYKQNLQCLAFSPDGEWLAYGDGWDPLPNRTPPGQLKLCHVESGKIIQLNGHKHMGIYGVAFSPDGQKLYSVGGGGIIWDVPSGKRLARLEGHQSAVFSVAVSSDGRTIATGSMDKTVRLWDSETGELRLTLEGHPYWVTAVAFNHDSTQLVSSSYDGQVFFWNAPKRQEPETNAVP